MLHMNDQNYLSKFFYVPSTSHQIKKGYVSKRMEERKRSILRFFCMVPSDNIQPFNKKVWVQ